MPSQVVALTPTAQMTVAAERENARWGVKSITVDNDAGGADRVIEVVDSFTADISDGQGNPQPQNIPRFQATILQGDIVTFNEQDLKGVRCLGALTIRGDQIDPNCHISVGYEPE